MAIRFFAYYPHFHVSSTWFIFPDLAIICKNGFAPDFFRLHRDMFEKKLEMGSSSEAGEDQDVARFMFDER